MTATDHKRTIDSYSAPHGSFATVTPPSMQFLMIDGHGDPNTSPVYAAAIGALYPLAYKLKFYSKKQLGQDFTVMPLEGLWWSADMAVFTSARDKSRWDWTMMIMQPDQITGDHVDEIRTNVAADKPDLPFGDVRLERLDEGECVQTLHVGPYDDEGPVLAQLHDEYLPAHGLTPTGKHHEIYLGDPRRSAPERLRTILRQPVQRGRRGLSARRGPPHDERT